MKKDAKYWHREMKAEEKAHEDFREQAEKVVEIYEDERERYTSEFNILWSNTEVMHSALYARTPNPDIRRRYLDRDPAGKKASELAERAVSYALDVYDFDGTMDEAINDYLLTSIGMVRMRYNPFFEEREGEVVPLMEMEGRYYNGMEEVTEYETDELGFAYLQGKPTEELVYEEVTCEAVNWRRFRWQPCDKWENCDWTAIEYLMDEDELKENYPDKWQDIPQQYTDKGEKLDPENTDKAKALIFEIFDKKGRQFLEIADGYDEILKAEDDPLNLEHFFPHPKPLLGTTKNGKLVPIPDYVYYQDQARELNRVTDRINCLIEQLKYRGIYDGTVKSTIENLETAKDGTFLPLDEDWLAVANAGGQADMRKIIAEMPTDSIVRILQVLYQNRDEIKQTIYEITGIADIMRGSTQASETLGAQQLKTQFGSMRIGRKQRRVQNFIRDIIRLKVEVMVENFSPETLQMMTGIEIDEQVLQILTNDLLRSYRIDIETDSTIAEDAATEKQNRIEFVTAVSGFLEKVAPMVQAGILPQNVASEMLGFAVRGFKVGRSLEDTLDEMAASDDDPRMKMMQQQFQQAQEQMQAQMQEQMQGMQQQAGKAVQDAQKQAFEAQKKLAVNNAVNEAKMFETQTKAELERSSQNYERDLNEYKAQLQMMTEVFKTEINKQQQEPIQRMDMLGEALNQVVTLVGELDARNQQAIGDLGQRFADMGEKVVAIEEYQKKPAKAVKQKDGSWVASRE